MANDIAFSVPEQRIEIYALQIPDETHSCYVLEARSTEEEMIQALMETDEEDDNQG
eukprot:SAG11_NODE_37163_length_258_cov_0.647799_1_plen_55_part_10